MFVLKNINAAQTELQLIPLSSEVNDSILVLKKDLQDLPYVNTLRERFILVEKMNAER